MSKKGKLLEQLVRSIEETVNHDSNIEVRSNVKMKNNTGIMREFDVVINDKTSPDNGLIVIECKNHKHKIDIQYIDAFFGKCYNMRGISKKVFVSSSGFTKNAIKEAASKNIVLHTLAKATKKDNVPKFDASFFHVSASLLPKLIFTVEGHDDTYEISLDELVYVHEDGKDIDFLEITLKIIEGNNDSLNCSAIECCVKHNVEKVLIPITWSGHFQICGAEMLFNATSIGMALEVECLGFKQELSSEKIVTGTNTSIHDFTISGSDFTSTIIKDGRDIQMFYKDEETYLPLEAIEPSIFDGQQSNVCDDVTN